MACLLITFPASEASEKFLLSTFLYSYPILIMMVIMKWRRNYEMAPVILWKGADGIGRAVTDSNLPKYRRRYNEMAPLVPINWCWQIKNCQNNGADNMKRRWYYEMAPIRLCNGADEIGRDRFKSAKISAPTLWNCADGIIYKLALTDSKLPYRRRYYEMPPIILCHGAECIDRDRYTAKISAPILSWNSTAAW